MTASRTRGSFPATSPLTSVVATTGPVGSLPSWSPTARADADQDAARSSTAADNPRRGGMIESMSPYSMASSGVMK